MITLTTPIAVPAVLGSNATISYDKLVFDDLTYSPESKRIVGTVLLMSSANPNQQQIQGSFIVSVSAGTMQIVIPQLNFQQTVALNPAAITSVQGFINVAQSQIEQGAISVGLVAGTQIQGT